MVAPRYTPGPPPKTKAIVDIIPVLSFSNGRRIELGVARYEVEEEWRDMPSFTIQNVTPYGRIDNLGWAHMEFIVRLSSANQPQPKAIDLDAVSAYPTDLIAKIQHNSEYGKRDLRVRVDELASRINAMDHERTKLMRVLDHHFPGTVCWKSNCRFDSITVPHLFDEFHRKEDDA